MTAADTGAPPVIRQSTRPILSPRAGCPWAETAVLNPAIIEDSSGGMIHMLFRASGPFEHRREPGRPAPYPIFLGYAVSADGGLTWDADFSRPALAPAMETESTRIVIRAAGGGNAVNHANGCIEDPRLMRIDETLYLSVACRMFPPGPYWISDDPMQCAPGWAARGGHAFGIAAEKNITVTTLFRVHEDRLAARDYDRAFEYVAPLTHPDRGENRDAFLFPERISVQGRIRYVCLHRPWDGSRFPGGRAGMKPSIWISTADRIEDIGTDRAEHRILAEPLFDWERERIGASWPPIKIADGEWLISCHGKKDAETGYTQSFLIAKFGADGMASVTHRCPGRLMFARHDWELDKSMFATPCVFTTGGIIRDGELLMAYGAADRFIGTATAPFDELVSYIRHFDENGHTVIPVRQIIHE